MTPHRVKELLLEAFPSAAIEVGDLTGTSDHFTATIVSDRFSGLNTLKQHRLVYSAVQEHIDSGEIHALQLKTFSPEQWQRTSIQISAP